jgi:hypothetical protein
MDADGLRDDINLNGSPGMAPGAGGGGAGALGKGAIGGEGGGGGEIVSTVLTPDDIGPNSAFDHFEIQVGAGGVAGPGGDTILSLCDKNGRVLRSIVAKGGKMGAPGNVPPPSRAATDDDVKAGLKVTGILAADFIRQKNGLWTIVDGGWDFYTANTIPFQMALPLLIEIETGTIAPETIIELQLRVQSPTGFQVLEKQQLVWVPNATELVRRTRFAVSLEFTASQAGLWYVHVVAATHVIGEYPIEVRLPIVAGQ